tara:strand:- start:85 stop:996 length:912 start_codon:yes stop_codon:yes gene_type:complete
MSKQITGNASLPTVIKALGAQGVHQDVDVNITGHVNRDTQSKRIRKYLKPGWIWALYSPIIVAKFPNENKEMLLLDGDHRRHMFKLAFPEEKVIPAYVVQVDSMKKYHELFVELNFKNRANISREEVFVHQVKAMDSDAVKINNELINCGVSVYGSSEPGGTVGDVNGPKVKVGAFNRTLDRGPAHAKRATKILTASWPDDEKLCGELMEAIAVLCMVYPYLRNGSKIALDFENWFSIHLSPFKQNLIAKMYKDRGGAVVNKHAESIARGLITEFRQMKLVDGATQAYKKRKLDMKKIHALID